jgi:GTPase SAR1 family protein
MVPKPRFIIFHGLPGSGKTTLCKRMIQDFPERYYYVNIGGHPDFRKRPMTEICASDYVLNGAGRDLITEAVLEKSAAKFASAVSSNVRKESGIEFEKVDIFLLDCDVNVLATRRSRTADEYRALRERMTVQSGGGKFNYHTLGVGADPVEKIVDRVRLLLA